MYMKNKKILIPILIVLLAVLALLIFFAVRSTANENIEDAGTSAHADRPVTSLERDGEQASLKRNMDTLLILGTDNYDKPNETGIDLYYNFDQSDFLVVLVFDNHAGTVQAIQLNRDTMCNVYWLDVIGQVGGTVYQHLAFAHTYGSGKEDSCEVTKMTVQDLLFGAPLDNYVAFTMDAVPILNDLVGGVTVSIDRDMTIVDPAFTKGTTLTLMGNQALTYARARMALGDTDNEARLYRQRTYLEGLIKSATEAFHQDSSLPIKFYNAAEQYMCTDMDASYMSEIADKFDRYEYLGMLSPAGEDVEGELFNEFYVDQDDLWNIVKTAFCDTSR